MIKKYFVTGLLGLAMAVSLAGCQSGSAASSNEVKPAQESKAENSEQAQDQTKLEGDLTVYTSQPEADIQALVEVFNESYPDVDVEIFRSGTEEVVSKVLAEKETNSLQADVILVADAATFESLKEEDLLMSYESKELDGINSEFYDADHTYTGTKIISTGIIVNTDVVKSEITSLKDLLKPEIKDELIMPSPLYSGAAAYNLGVITRTYNLGWDFYQGIKENGVTVGKGNGTVQTAVLAGEKGCGIIVDYMAIRAKAEGAPVEFIYPSEGSLIVTEPIGIIKGTEQEDIAKAFVDFILSEDGQKATSEIGYTPIKSGVEAPEGFKAADEIKNLTFDIKTLVETREADKEAFAKMFE
ncbi:MAG: ABC transporter substrate-binding protein [Sedimentibacter sp.]|uniref:ABC transporter substrate-binding protein n=1 Tax=Sedimentibacter sp. TaxID=1960295 RepID=UPI00298200A1|nr:ABC transporter substrate-binding protein [Sedimentibacter sp.]MDW5299950.1 ABC transporter substrate-binding protein [Sedimentibacter sp.]